MFILLHVKMYKSSAEIVNIDNRSPHATIKKGYRVFSWESQEATSQYTAFELKNTSGQQKIKNRD